MNSFGKIFKNKDVIRIQVPVIFFEEDGIYFANVPPLDITGYGKTEQEAKESLDIMVDEFFNYTIENKTLDQELMKLGWKRAAKMESPSLSELITHNDQLKNIVDTKRFRADTIQVNMPASA